MPITATLLRRASACALIAAIAAQLSMQGAAAADLVLMPVKFLDTSHEPRDQRAEHEKRLALFANALAGGLSPETVRVVTVPEIADACATQTPECLMDVAKNAGGGHVLFVSVQKASTLIGNVYALEMDSARNRVVARRDISFRGDTDEAWRRAGAYLASALRP